MPIQKNAGRQDLLVAYVDIALGDLTAGVAQAAIDLPHGAVLVGGDAVVKTPFNAATTATLKVGDKGDDDRYGSLDLKTAGRTALTLTGYKHNVGEPLLVHFAQTGTAATTGALRLAIQYYVEGRAAFSQG